MRNGLLAILISLSFTAGQAIAQAQREPDTHGSVELFGVSSAELPSLLDLVRGKIGSVGFGDKWQMPQSVLNEDLIVADQITLYSGKPLRLAPKNADGNNMVLFIARTIRVEGSSEPVRIFWETNPASQIREPVKMGKASSGLTGERDGADGRPGTDGVSGNRGISGRDAPTVIFIALKLEASGPIHFQLNGQDGAPGGPGQDAGDGGPGRPGRPGVLVASSLGVLVKQGSPCERPIHGGNGGAGGNGGLGGPGGHGGHAGSVAVILPGITIALVRNFIDRSSELRAGKGGARGARGIRGRGGAGAPGIPAVAPCEASAPGKEGAQGTGRAPDARAAPDVGPVAPDGDNGTVIYASLTESQARSIGLLQQLK